MIPTSDYRPPTGTIVPRGASFELERKLLEVDLVSNPQLLAPPLCPSPPRNCFRSRVALSVNGADGGGRGNWGRNLLLLRARFSLSSFVREPPPQGHGAKEEGASALSRLEWNRPRAKFLMERVCLSSPASVACDAVVGMRKRPTECELSLHHDSRHSRAHIQMHQSEWLKVEILLQKTTRITRISYIRTGVITLSSLRSWDHPSSFSSSAHLPSCHSFHTDDDRHVHR